MVIGLNDLEVLRSNQESVYSEILGREINPDLYLSIVTTNKCQLNCPYCINGGTDKSLDLPLEKALSNIKKAKDMLGIKECVILGGEPFMYKHLDDLIDGLKEMNFRKLCLTTNGVALTKLDKINDGITHLNISFHNYCNKLFTFDDLKETYIKLKTTNRNLKIRINTNVYKGNHDSVISLYHWIQAISPYCDSIRVSNIISQDSFSVNEKNTEGAFNTMLTNDKYNNLFDELIERYSAGYTCIDNPDSLGFVDYVLIPAKTPIIINRNIGSKVADQVCENSKQKINTVKCLVSGDISLSWNKNNIINL